MKGEIFQTEGAYRRNENAIYAIDRVVVGAEKLYEQSKVCPGHAKLNDVDPFLNRKFLFSNAVGTSAVAQFSPHRLSGYGQLLSSQVIQEG